MLRHIMIAILAFAALIISLLFDDPADPVEPPAPPAPIAIVTAATN